MLDGREESFFLFLPCCTLGEEEHGQQTVRAVASRAVSMLLDGDVLILWYLWTKI